MNHYVFLIDNSSSMTLYLRRLVETLNIFLSTLKENSIMTRSYISFASFNSSLNWIVKGRNIEDFDTIDISQFGKPGTTSLYDSVCQTIIEFGVDTKIKTYFYIITDGDDNSSLKYDKEDADKLCNTAITCGNWEIKHFVTMNYSTLSVPRIQFDIDNVSSLLNTLKIK